MSARLVAAVFNSALPAWLKPYATAFASFAADDGSRVYPSIARVAKMVGRSPRATQTAAAELRRRKVLVLERQRARDRATRYAFDPAALPWIGDGSQYQLFPQVLVQKPGQKSATGKDFHRRPQQLTGSGLHPMGEVGFTRSISDQSVRTTTRRDARKTGMR